MTFLRKLFRKRKPVVSDLIARRAVKVCGRDTKVRKRFILVHSNLERGTKNG